MSIQIEEGSIVDKNLTLIIAVFLFLKNIKELFFLEFKLAKESVKFIIIYSALFFMLAISTWLMTLAIFTLIFHDLLGGWLIPFAITSGLNLILIVILTMQINTHIKDLYKLQTLAIFILTTIYLSRKKLIGLIFAKKDIGKMP